MLRYCRYIASNRLLYAIFALVIATTLTLGTSQSYAKSKDKKPSKGEAKIALRSAKLYIKQNLLNKALKQLEISVTGDPENEEARFLLGQVYAKKGMYQEMNQAFERALELKPKKHRKEIKKLREIHWVKHYNDGVRFIQGGKFGKATEKFERATLVDTTEADGFNMLGLAYLKTERTDGAVQAYQRATQLDPNHLESRVNLAIIYYNGHQFDQAGKWFKAASDLTPENVDLLRNLALAHEYAGEIDSALAVCNRAIELDPEHQELRSYTGHLYFDKKQYEEAVEHFEKILEMAPDDKEGIFNLALCYTRLEQLDKATALAKRAVEASPEDGDAWYQLGHIYTQNADALAAQGDTLGALTKVDSAIVVFKKALALKPDSQRGWEALSIAYARRDMPTESKVAFEKAQNLSEVGK